MTVISCLCGKPAVRRGECLSCAMRRIATKHGQYKTAEYYVWDAMCRRCELPTNPRYSSYGGRGIRVADAWRGPGGFERFIAHVGPRPSNGHSIDRTDNNGNYEPGNVRWATRSEQQSNRRCNRRIEWDGRTLTTLEWARLYGLRPHTLHTRLDRGWPIGRAITARVSPVRGGRAVDQHADADDAAHRASHAAGAR